jgi:hypothetical protein
MNESYENWTDRYLLRHLAGRYFLIRIGTDDPKYRKPVETDETGAEFWRALCRYRGEISAASKALSDTFHAPDQEVRADLTEFCRTVKQKMGELM